MYWLKQYFTRPSTHFYALAEVFVTLCWAISPFVVAYLVQSARLPGDQFVSFWQMFDRGQIFLLAYGVFGPIFWLAFIKIDVPRHNARALLGVVSLFAVIPVIGLIGVDSSMSSIENQVIISWGYWFYGFVLFLNYLLVFYCAIDPPSAEVTLGKSSASMKDKYQEEFGNE